jgi:hypothetical protein
MNPNQKGARRHHKGLRLWTHARALGALPYLASVVRSLREHRLDLRRHRLEARRLADRPGRPDRARLLAGQHALNEAREAEVRYEEALKELRALEVTSLDAVRGQALIPFLHKKKLAWFVFDLFDPEPLRFWRYQDDPVDLRRPVGVSEDGPVP